MKPISQLRFNSLAGYSRLPIMPLIISELGWFEEANEKVLGLIALDLTDGDYSCYVLGRDAKGRFRAVWVGCSIPTVEEAYAELDAKLQEHAQMPPSAFYSIQEKDFPGGPRLSHAG